MKSKSWQLWVMNALVDHDVLDAAIAPDVHAAAARLLDTIDATLGGLNSVVACVLGPARKFVIELVQVESALTLEVKKLKADYKALYRAYCEQQRRYGDATSMARAPQLYPRS